MIRVFHQPFLRRCQVLGKNAGDVVPKLSLGHRQICCLSKDRKDRATAYLALGSNVGDRIQNIERACRVLDERGIQIVRTSSLWETEPMYMLNQDPFINGVCEVETTLEPLALLDALQDIENGLGRVKLVEKGPRSIDLDILLYGNEVVDSDRLKIPHIGIPEREFVLRPLVDIAPHLPIHPQRPWIIASEQLQRLVTDGHTDGLAQRIDNMMTPLTILSNRLPPLRPQKHNRETKIMGVLNITPDSFSDGGQPHSKDLEALVSVASEFISSGATILDIGGQSTAPNHFQEVGPEVETARVLPVLKALQEIPEIHRGEVAVSIDTYHSSVARVAVTEGHADIVNDVSAGCLDRNMFPTVAQLGCSVILSHMRGTPSTMQTPENLVYNLNQGSTGKEQSEHVLEGVAQELAQRVAAAERAGIRRWRMILDPGLGFSKTVEQNLALIRHLPSLRNASTMLEPSSSRISFQGLPWLLGPSRKGFIGKITGIQDPSHRDWGTAAAVCASVANGADIVRVHDVRHMKHVIQVADAIWRR